MEVGPHVSAGRTAPLPRVEEVRRDTADPAGVVDERLIEELSQIAAIIDPLPEDVEVVVRTMFSRDNSHSSTDEPKLNWAVQQPLRIGLCGGLVVALGGRQIEANLAGAPRSSAVRVSRAEPRQAGHS